jgi:hypothetical protein
MSFRYRQYLVSLTRLLLMRDIFIKGIFLKRNLPFSFTRSRRKRHH